MPDGVRYPDVSVDLTGLEGRPIAAVFAVASALRRAGVGLDDRETYATQAMATKDFDGFRRVTEQWVEVA